MCMYSSHCDRPGNTIIKEQQQQAEHRCTVCENDYTSRRRLLINELGQRKLWEEVEGERST
jgi:tRNA G26 N,N-dimethylase Trm1